MTKVIADISGNHGGSLERAIELIKAAADCGCDYAKFQYYKPELMPDQENRELYDKLHVSYKWLEHLFDAAETSGIPLFASVFDVKGVEWLSLFDVPYFKIASPESTRLNNYYEIVGEIKRKTPIIFSTGEWDRDNITSLYRRGDVLLYCPPGHPTPRIRPYDLNVYRDGHYDGLSDHCADLSNASLFIEAEAEWIERHIKLDDDCIDAAFSSNPKEMTELCKLAHQ